MLDTNICIYIIKQQPLSVLAKFASLPIGSEAMSLVTYGELEFSALRSNNAIQACTVFEELANYIPVCPCPGMLQRTMLTSEQN
jgi:tRNA(fMet)-specific endonuclease VapC